VVAAVTGRAVELEWVFARHAGADVSAAYAVLVAPRRARTRAAQVEGGRSGDQCGDLRAGVLGAAEEGPDDRLADREPARARRRPAA
jgi:hypothetical protein